MSYENRQEIRKRLLRVLNNIQAAKKQPQLVYFPEQVELLDDISRYIWEIEEILEKDERENNI